LFRFCFDFVSILFLFRFCFDFVFVSILFRFCFFFISFWFGLVSFYFLFKKTLHLSGGNDGIAGLHEVVLHVTLKVEIGKLVLLVDLEELGELLIGVDAATILLILETIGLDIAVNLLAHVRASHLGANRLAKELSKLIADAGGLDKARGLAVDVVTTLLGRSLLGILHLTGNGLLKRLEIILDGGKKTNKLLELGVELSELEGDRRSLGSRGSLSCGPCGRRKLIGWCSNNGLNLGLLGAGLGLSYGGYGYGLGFGDGGCGSGGCGLRRSNHTGCYIILSRIVFKLFFPNIYI